ncbi:hypothetical protein KDN32_01415 [Nocardioides sp. J2M5]|uniref:hypothetical protein n=1 Tax=Nocardioides palaemonis TaxID=2829810 RepID=UPI001BAA9A57|nr:hypothetical protein [Nocardioides palaemonis]MBS2936395.1 hypothetical protein [Nocardioides palaemonis]
MDLDTVVDLLLTQRGVISRRQLLARGLTQTRIDTLLRRRDLVLLHPGTYLTHTGRPTWDERSWAAVLHSGLSALHLGSALHRPGREPPPAGPVHVAVDWSRRVAPQPGIHVHRVRGLEHLVQWNASPPRVRLEVAAVEVAHRATDDLAAISALASVVGGRRTVASRLRVEVERRSRLRRRGLLNDLLADLERGTHSVLEHGYLVRVLRPHGLPEPTSRQVPVRSATGRQYRDVGHLDLDGGFVELDGSQHDGSEARDDDADRDLDDLARGSATLRLRYRQVFTTPCRTAARLDTIFRARGWEGTARPCSSPACDLRGGSS